MKVDETIILNYDKLLKSIPELLKKYRVSQKELAELFEISPPAFKYKLDELTFTPDELLKIVKYINALP